MLATIQIKFIEYNVFGKKKSRDETMRLSYVRYYFAVLLKSYHSTKVGYVSWSGHCFAGEQWEPLGGRQEPAAGGALTAEHVQHDGRGVEVGGRARVVAGVLAPRAVDY